MSELEEVVKAFGVPERPSSDVVPRANVLRWSNSADMEAQGALYSYVMNPAYASRISPAMTLEDYLSFVPRYLERCFIEDRETDWLDGRYSAGWSLANWLVKLADQEDASRVALPTLASWLGDLYRRSTSDVRRAIVDATLEHAFERPAVRKYFDAWTRDPDLKVAHEEAMAWVSRGGNSPIGNV